MTPVPTAPVYHTSAVYGGRPQPQRKSRRPLIVAVTAGVLAVAVLAVLVAALAVSQVALAAEPTVGLRKPRSRA